MNDSQEHATQGKPEQSPARSMPEAQTSRNMSLGAGINIGSIISRAFATLMKKPAVFFGLSCCVMIPPAIINVLLPKESGLDVITQILQMLLGLILQGAIAYAAYQVMNNKSVSIGDTVTRGMARFAPLALTSLLTSLGIVLGLVFLVVPGIILMCMWLVAIPACVVEKIGPVESLKRSAHLTKGYRLQIFGLMLLTYVLFIVIMFATVFLIFFITDNSVAAGLGAGLLGIVPQAFISVIYAIVYFDLRVLKEGISLGSLTSVFD